MNNPIEYIEKCTLEDLIEFRKGTIFFDRNRSTIVRNSTKIKDLFYIARVYLGCTDFEIAKKFKKSQNAVKSQISMAINKGITYNDQIDDLMREIAYWKFIQLQEYPLTPEECYHE